MKFVPSRLLRSLICVGSIAALLSPAVVFASDWLGGSAVWSSDGNPGWNGTGVPNFQGAIANHGVATATNSTLDLAVTVGTISVTNNSAHAWTITNNAGFGIFLDQDGAGPLHSTISISNTAVSTANNIFLTSAATTIGTIFLQDDVDILATGSGSTNTNGTIQINNIIAGNGTMTLNSAYPISSTDAASPGAIALRQPNTFVGNSTIQRGLVIAFFNASTPFGDASNTVTLGQNGMGSAALLSRDSVSLLNYNIVVDSSAGGETRMFGSAANTSYTVSTGNVTLNGNVDLRSGNALATPIHTYSGNWSGAGGINKTFSGAAVLSGTNTYTGTTTVTTGSLVFATPESLYNNQQGALAGFWNATNIVVNSGATLGFNVGSGGEFSEATIATLNTIGSATGGYTAGSFIGINPTVASYTYSTPITNSNGGANAVGLSKLGLNTLVLTGANTYTGGTQVIAGILQFNSPGAIGGSGASVTIDSGATGAAGYAIDQAFINRVVSTSAGVVGLAADSSNSLDFSAAGANLTAASLGATGNFTYSGTLTPNGTTYRLGGGGGTLTANTTLTGANGVAINTNGTGSGTVVLSGTNNYTGATTVGGGAIARVSSLNSVVGGTASSSLGAPTTVADGTIGLGATTTAGTLLYTGAGETSDRVINLSGSTGGATIENAGTGPLNFTSSSTSAGGTKSLTLRASNTGGANTFTRLQGTGVTLRKEGVGTWILAGANTNTGEVRVTEGTLRLTGTNTGSNYLVGDTASLTSELILDGTSATQTGVFYGGFVNGSNATVRHNAGAVSGSSFTSIGRDAGSMGAYIHTGGTWSTRGDFNVGDYGTGVMTQSAGDVTAGTATTTGSFIAGWQPSAIGTVTMDGGTINANAWVMVGYRGAGTMTQNGGTITANSFNLAAGGRAFGVGVDPTGVGTFTQNHGAVVVNGDWYVTGVSGQGTSFQNNDSTINATTFALAQNASATGTHTMNAPTGSITTATTGQFYIGLSGIGTFNLQAGTVTAGASGTGNLADVRIGNNASGNGTFNQTGGTMSVADQTYVGLSGLGAYNMGGGTYSAGDNFYIGLNAGSVGTMTMTAGTVSVVGNDPSFTGNFIVGNNGTGTLNMDGGVIDLVVGPTSTNTNNSYSYSIANNVGGPGHELDLAQDGNFLVGRVLGAGTVNQTAGTIRVGANVSVGGGDAATLTGTTGIVTMSGGQMLVGMTSPTGGDLVLGFVPSSTGTFNLNGGTLDVTRGSGRIGAALGTTAFNFTGGTLRVKEYNPTTFGGSLAPLAQTGATSVLDVTANSTTLHGGYTVTDGTALVAKQLTVNGDVNLSSNGELQWQMTGLNSANPGDWFGQIALTGNLVLGGTSDLELDFGVLGTNGPAGTHTYWDANHSWKIIDTSTNTGNTTFATLTGGTFANGIFSISVGAGADLGDIFLNYAAVGPAVPGDFDGDGDVDGADFVAWQTNFPLASGAVYGQGDADFDGDVDGADFVVWQTNFPFPAGPGASPVPEPATLLLGAISAIGLMTLRRRNS